MLQTISNTKKNCLTLVGLCLLLGSGACFAIGYLISSFNTLLCGVLALYLSSLLYCLTHIRRRCVLLFFYVTFWVFLLSRPTISMLRGDVWWYYGVESALFSLNLMYISLFCLYIGNLITDRILAAKGYFDQEHTDRFFDKKQLGTEFHDSLRKISGFAYCISIGFSLIAGAEKLLFMAGRDYADFYVEFTTSLPFFVQAIGVFMPYFLCVYLATMPQKLHAFIALVLYVGSTIPTLLVGARNSTVLAILLAWIYFIIRDYLDGTKYWIGKFERICIIIALPLALAFLGYYNYAREGTTFQDGGISSLIVDLFYKQGVSFDVMNRAYTALPDLPDEVSKLYTFGGFIDYLKHGLFARELFGTFSLGEGNNVIKAVYGNSFAHSLAYVAEPNYLSGHGMGSSYLLETYADFGYIGVGIFSFGLSVFMNVAIPLFKKSTFARIFILNCLTLFFLISRAEATGWLNFIIYAQFWVAVIFCYLCANIVTDTSTHKIKLGITNKKRGNQYA